MKQSDSQKDSERKMKEVRDKEVTGRDSPETDKHTQTQTRAQAGVEQTDLFERYGTSTSHLLTILLFVVVLTLRL